MRARYETLRSAVLASSLAMWLGLAASAPGGTRGDAEAGSNIAAPGGSVTSVRDRGATGNDESDDTEAFNRAIVEAAGGTVFVPPGRYFLINLDVSVPHKSILGAGKVKTMLTAFPNADGSPMIRVRTDKFAIRDCALDGNAPKTRSRFSDSFAGRVYSAALAAYRADGMLNGLTVDSCYFAHVRGAAIADRDVNAVAVSDCTFADNMFESVFHALTIRTGADEHLHGFTFLRNTITNCRSGHGSVNANGLLVHQTESVAIERNTWDGFERNAMKLEHCGSGRIAENTIRNGDLSFAGIGLQNGARNMTVSNNTLTNVGTGIDASGNAGTRGADADAIQGVTICDNIIHSVHRGAMPNGIRLLGYGAAMEDITITGNRIRNVPGDAIQLRQFAIYHPHATMTRITIRHYTGTNVGRACVSFAGSDVQPTALVETDNHCK